MDTDARIRTASRLLTLLAFLTFLAWLALKHPLVLLAAVLLAVAAYGFFRWDLRRNPIDIGVGMGADSKDRVMEGSETTISPGLSVGGIHLTFETRTRWRRRR